MRDADTNRLDDVDELDTAVQRCLAHERQIHEVLIVLVQLRAFFVLLVQVVVVVADQVWPDDVDELTQVSR